jgi:hypothetical protein
MQSKGEASVETQRLDSGRHKISRRIYVKSIGYPTWDRSSVRSASQSAASPGVQHDFFARSRAVTVVAVVTGLRHIPGRGIGKPCSLIASADLLTDAYNSWGDLERPEHLCKGMLIERSPRAML